MTAILRHKNRQKLDNTVKSKDLLRYSIIILLTIIGNLLFYSYVTLYGYWTDTLFLLVTVAISLYLLKPVTVKFVKTSIKIISYFNIFIICFNSFNIWHGILPVHFIHKGHFKDNEEYAYFIESVNTGLTSGCYGVIQYHKTIKAFPLLEINIETDHCSQLNYNDIINENY